MFTKVALSLMLVSVLVPAGAALAYDPAYNYQFIISDDQLLNYRSMNADTIQGFLANHGSQLAGLSFNVNGSTLSAAQIIYNASQTYQINPKVILVTLQKEESLVDDGGVYNQVHIDWAMGYSVCDSCGGSGSSSYKGFPQQIDQGTAAFRRYYNSLQANGYTISGWGPTYIKQLYCYDYEVSDGFCPTTSTPVSVQPANFVTSALYTYTPHFHGNYNFWRIWTRWGFDAQLLYPDGSLLKAQGGYSFYLIENGQKRRFVNLSAFYSRYSPKKVITVPADHLLQYPSGPDINFANYSLLQVPNGGIYLLVNNVKRPIASSAAFRNAGFSREEIVKVKWSEVNNIPDGDPITTENIYPAGQLLQNNKTGGIFYVKDGVKHPVFSKYIYQDQYGRQRPTRVSPAKLDTYTEGAPVGFKDGNLIQAKGDPMIYVISNGYRLPIANPTTFATYRFSFSNVMKVDSTALWIHPLGPALDSTSGTVELANH